MKKTNLKIKNWILFLVCILLLGYCILPAEGWRITDELKEEIKIKKEALEKNPDDAHAHFDLAITYAYTNHIIDGWAKLKKVVEIDPSFKKTGLRMYIKKVTAEPNDWRLRFRLAFAYYFNDKKEAAIRELDNVILIDPYNVWAYGYIALIYGEMGETDKAMEYCKRGLAIDSNVAALHLLLAEGYYKKGDSWTGFKERMEALRLRALGY
ncbi:MAG: hypothetical protein KKA31_02325 [Candidatus Margulisbacteria bacterium]|nr:hypothetical protein [Candidatus Margulisiibacteriota bacterium]